MGTYMFYSKTCQLVEIMHTTLVRTVRAQVLTSPLVVQLIETKYIRAQAKDTTSAAVSPLQIVILTLC